jgi:hypothetical protein
MCDFSLEMYKSRRAEKGDTLTTYKFATGTIGMCQPGEVHCPTCLQPGTELAFDAPIRLTNGVELLHSTATFVQFECAVWERTGGPMRHRDGIETPDNQRYLLQNLAPGQTLSVLQVPAEPTVESIAKELGLAEPAPRDRVLVEAARHAGRALANARRE